MSIPDYHIPNSQTMRPVTPVVRAGRNPQSHLILCLVSILSFALTLPMPGPLRYQGSNMRQWKAAAAVCPQDALLSDRRTIRGRRIRSACPVSAPRHPERVPGQSAHPAPEVRGETRLPASILAPASLSSRPAGGGRRWCKAGTGRPPREDPDQFLTTGTC